MTIVSRSYCEATVPVGWDISWVQQDAAFHGVEHRFKLDAKRQTSIGFQKCNCSFLSRSDSRCVCLNATNTKGFFMKQRGEIRKSSRYWTIFDLQLMGKFPFWKQTNHSNKTVHFHNKAMSWVHLNHRMLKNSYRRNCWCVDPWIHLSFSLFSWVELEYSERRKKNVWNLWDLKNGVFRTVLKTEIIWGQFHLLGLLHISP